jgi:hypothetical protein
MGALIQTWPTITLHVPASIVMLSGRYTRYLAHGVLIQARNGQFQLDWQRVAVKSRFRRLIAREDKVRAQVNKTVL